MAQDNTKLYEFSNTNNNDFIITLIAPDANAESCEINTALLNLVMKDQFFGLPSEDVALLDEAARTDITRKLTQDWFYRRALHTGGWRVSVSPTLFESGTMNRVLSEDQKAITIPRCGF